MGKTIVGGKDTKVERTERWKQSVLRAYIAEQVKDELQRRRFNRLIESGLIRRG